MPIVCSAKVVESTKSWNLAVITGPLSADKRIKYYLQPQLNLADDKYKLNNAQVYVGMGYQLDDYKVGWLMSGYSWGITSSGDIRRIEILRQQLSWNMSEFRLPYMSSTTRLEERKNLDESAWHVRLREQISIRLPFKSWPNHSLITYDEVFININHPAWIHSSSLMGQNRFFIGIGTSFSPEVILDIGYLNQYEFKQVNEMSNVLQIRLNLNS